MDDLNCTTPNCLNYKDTPGTSWFYHNATYNPIKRCHRKLILGLHTMIFTNQKVKMKIGMGGSWIQSNYNNIYWSTSRDMARFGLLILNEGVWDEQVILNDANYFSNMIKYISTN